MSKTTKTQPEVLTLWCPECRLNCWPVVKDADGHIVGFYHGQGEPVCPECGASMRVGFLGRPVNENQLADISQALFITCDLEEYLPDEIDDSYRIIPDWAWDEAKEVASVEAYIDAEAFAKAIENNTAKPVWTFTTDVDWQEFDQETWLVLAKWASHVLSAAVTFVAVDWQGQSLSAYHWIHMRTYKLMDWLQKIVAEARRPVDFNVAVSEYDEQPTVYHITNQSAEAESA